MKLEFMLVLPVFGKIFRRQLSEVVKVEGTVLVDALMNVEMLAVLLLDENVSAEWAIKDPRLRFRRAFKESIITDLVEELTSPASVVINVDRRSSAMRTDDI